MQFVNHDLESLITPLDVDKYEKLLLESDYSTEETKFLVNGFREGFDIGYTGPERRSESRNIPFTVGNHVEMWNKIMKEVQMKRVAGPYEEVPFDNYIQSPIGLVPKAGNKTRLIFHLSYDFDEENRSVNACTPRERCTVKYNDLDAAIQLCLQLHHEAQRKNKEGDREELVIIYLGKTGLSSAFRVLCMNRKSFRWLVFKAKDPKDGKVKFFVDKCLPFGASISCAHYQRFSNSLRHLIQYRTSRRSINNYLDDFLFMALAKYICNMMIQRFLDLCSELRIPVANEKTEWATTTLIFLGILLDGEHLLLSIPIEKQEKALKLLQDISGKKKVTVKQLQVLTGYLNFLTWAIFAGRTFNRRIYAKYSSVNKKLKQHHHVAVDSEFRFDCQIWRLFLENHRESALCRPMVDMEKMKSADELFFYTDASARPDLGMGGILYSNWFSVQWEPGFIKNNNPSIEYLELLAVTTAVLTWSHLIQNQRIILFCDNQAVVSMINNMVSTCKNCMYLLRLVTLNNLIHNRRIFAKWVETSKNDLADALSRMQYRRFWNLVRTKEITVNQMPSLPSSVVWPVSKIWKRH